MIFLSQATPHFLGVKESEGRTPLGPAGSGGVRLGGSPVDSPFSAQPRSLVDDGRRGVESPRVGAVGGEGLAFRC